MGLVMFTRVVYMQVVRGGMLALGLCLCHVQCLDAGAWQVLGQMFPDMFWLGPCVIHSILQ